MHGVGGRGQRGREDVNAQLSDGLLIYKVGLGHRGAQRGSTNATFLIHTNTISSSLTQASNTATIVAKTISRNVFSRPYLPSLSLPFLHLSPQASNSATIATEAAALLLNASRTLVIQMAQSIAVSALTVITGSPNSTAGNFSADPAYTAYIGCLNARAVGARWSFKLQRYTPPSGDYITALLSGGGAGTTVVATGGGTAEMGTTASATAAMGGSGGAAAAPPARRLYTFSNDVAADANGSGSGSGSNSTLIGSYNLTGDLTNSSLIGYLSGYPIQQVPQGATLYIASGNSTVRRRTVGVKGNLLMGGAFLHQV